MQSTFDYFIVKKKLCVGSTENVLVHELDRNVCSLVPSMYCFLKEIQFSSERKALGLSLWLTVKQR